MPVFFLKVQIKYCKLKVVRKEIGLGNIFFARIITMTPDIKRSVVATYQLKIETRQIC